MAPRFKGGSDDWLDDEESSGKGKSAPRKKKPTKEAPSLPPEQANATVAEVFPDLCRARMDTGGSRLCSYRRSALLGKTGQEGLRERSPVAVGDRILVETVGADNGIVAGSCTRENRLVRTAPDREDKNVHVLVTNLDCLVIVAAAVNPEFSPGLADRFLVAASIEKIPTLLCINKFDLRTEGAPLSWRLYQDLGVELAEVSAKRGDGVDALRKKLIGRRVAFCGHSGVGKTSLLTKLMGVDAGRVANVNESTGKGRHTTTGAVLLEGPGGSQWIDTPGVREFGLLGVKPEELSSYFPELAALGCSLRECKHGDEPDCMAKDLPRHSSYRRIYQSLTEGEG